MCRGAGLAPQFLKLQLFSGTSKGIRASLFSQIKYKICNNDVCDHQLPYSCIFRYGLSFIADIADDGMDLSTVSGVNRW